MSNRKLAKHAPPELLSRGRYAIYEAPNGDGVITYRPDGEENDSHQVIPSKFWGLVMKVLRGEMSDVNPVALLKMLAGGK
jgi:hypothetical protein